MLFSFLFLIIISLGSGCGEQVMINFVPSLVVLDYLTSTNQVNDDIRKKATSYLQSGYQQELKYQTNSGEYLIKNAIQEFSI
jgi:CD109 antigen